jgi:hypothetical protein
MKTTSKQNHEAVTHQEPNLGIFIMVKKKKVLNLSLSLFPSLLRISVHMVVSSFKL